MTATEFDWVIIGSGFGGSVSALRLAEKGYRVLVIEKGKRFAPSDFPRNNWDLRKWMWQPQLGMRGIFQMSFFEHLTVLHGVGVGGGSLTYANTLPKPPDAFFNAPSWSHLDNWKHELDPHYDTARRMLGAAENPCETHADRVLHQIGKQLGREDSHKPVDVAVYFGESGKRVSDPYFGGKGPDRVGCTFCGGCMTGCRVGAKNTLDMNYLYLAEKQGAKVVGETEVVHVGPRAGGGYTVTAKPSFGRSVTHELSADKVIFAGGVMGSMALLLAMRETPDGLPKLSPRLGKSVRTNSEALIGINAPGADFDGTKGIAITSILHTDEHSHVEPVRYGKGSTFFRSLLFPHVQGGSPAVRFARGMAKILGNPKTYAQVYFSDDWRASQILLYMRTLEGSLSFELDRSVRTGFRRGLVTRVEAGQDAPSPFIEEATDIAERYARIVGGVANTIITETLLGSSSTAHILGGACMGADASEGVIDPLHRVHGYDGLYVIDGSAISANPGVNPSLTITALAERAMSRIPERASVTSSSSVRG